MRKLYILLLVPIALFAVLFTGCDAEEMGSLKDISKPYTGIYECEKLLLGGKDYTDSFRSFTVELSGDGSFSLAYETAEGGRGGLGGNYSLDTEKGEITFTGKQGARSVSHTFPYEKGSILVDYNFFGTLLHAEFSMP